MIRFSHSGHFLLSLCPRILAAVPLAGLLVLFDLVIDNPTHPETTSNLALLDIGSGHFSRLEYSSQGTLPGSIASEFAHIARRYVQERSRSSSDKASFWQLSPRSNLAPKEGSSTMDIGNVSDGFEWQSVSCSFSGYLAFLTASFNRYKPLRQRA